jgi:hypothetical protein
MGAVRGRLEFVRLVVVLAAAGLPACTDLPSLEAACDHAVRVFRARRATCGGFVPMADEPTLIARETSSCISIWGAPGSRGGAFYWERCATTSEGTCEDSSFCGIYPRGTREMGQPCLVAGQCASLFCAGVAVLDQDGKRNPGAVQCGTCGTSLSSGVACNVETDSCQAGTPGMSCFRGVCRTRGGMGAPCDGWNDCADPLICTSAGTCGAGRQAGESCVGGADCGGELSCDPSTNTCAWGDYGQPGDACDTDFHACWLGRCDVAEGATTGVCPIVLPDGSACAPDDSTRTCDAYAYCVNGVCQILDPQTCG